MRIKTAGDDQIAGVERANFIADAVYCPEILRKLGSPGQWFIVIGSGSLSVAGFIGIAPEVRIFDCRIAMDRGGKD